MSADQLFHLAIAFADAHATAELRRAGSLTTGDLIDDTVWWENVAAGKREELRTVLSEAFRTTICAEPDDELPVYTSDRRSVEVRAVFDEGQRHIRVRYTPAQAVVAGAAMIACAATVDDLAGGALAELLLAFPSNTGPVAIHGAYSNRFGDAVPPMM